MWQLSQLRRSLACLLVGLPVFAGLGSGCSAEELLTLGRSPGTSPPDAAVSVESMSGTSASSAASDGGVPALPFIFDAPTLVEELYSEAKDDNPTLTWDMLEIYFSSKRGEENTDLWWARRDSVDEAFSEPEFLAEMSSPDFDTSPAIDGDGLTFWFSSVREDGLGGLDILQVTRATRGEIWGTPTLAVELNSEQDDIPRPTGAMGRIMPLGSRRDSETYRTYFAERPSVGEAFTGVNLAAELTPPDALTADAFLTSDGLTILYTQAIPPEAPGDLYMATRDSLAEQFGVAMAIDSLNTEADERDPWLSPDGKTVYFASDRDGVHAIYKAALR